jgi:hypothetical protein
MGSGKYLSVFTVATEQQRKENFEDYWKFTQQHGGELFETIQYIYVHLWQIPMRFIETMLT